MNISAVPCFLVTILIRNFLFESPRFLIFNNQYEAAKQVFNQMIQANQNGSLPINDLQMQEVKIWKENFYQNTKIGDLKELFTKNKLKKTISLWVIWSLVHCISIGQIQILPFIVGKSERAFEKLFFALLGEMPSIILSFFLIDNANFGRRGSLICFQLVCGLANLACYFNILIELSLFITRLCIRQSLSILYVK